MRFAVYFTCKPGSALGRFGDAVLGYDPGTGEAVSRSGFSFSSAPDLDAVTRGPGLYGFHATLKAPMTLRAGVSEAALLSEARAFAGSRPAVSVGTLELVRVDAFCALVPSQPCPTVDMLAAECVAYFDPFREPLGRSERDRRLGQPLSPRQMALLDRWGYPYVFDEFRFHMTLTGRLGQERREFWLSRLREAHADISHEPVVVDALSVLRQDEPRRPFRLVERIPLAE